MKFLHRKYIYGDAGTLRGILDGTKISIYKRPTIKDTWEKISTRKYTSIPKAKAALKRVHRKF